MRSGAPLARRVVKFVGAERLPPLPRLLLAADPARMRSNAFNGYKRLPCTF